MYLSLRFLKTFKSKHLEEVWKDLNKDQKLSKTNYGRFHLSLIDV